MKKIQNNPKIPITIKHKDVRVDLKATKEELQNLLYRPEVILVPGGVYCLTVCIAQFDIFLEILNINLKNKKVERVK